MKTRLGSTLLTMSLLLALTTLAASPVSAGSPMPTTAVTGANVIVIRAQDVTDGQVIVDSVTAAQDGWLLIRKDKKGAPGDVIGFVPVHPGTATNLRVDIQPTDIYGDDNITPTLWATLVADRNALIPLMSPGPLITKYASLAVVAFSSSTASEAPNLTGTYTILVHAQDVNAGQLTVDSVTAAQPSWLLIRKDDGGRPGDMIGFAAVPQGTTTGVRVDLQLTDYWGDDNITPTLWATLVPDTSAAIPLAAPDSIALQSASAAVVAFSSSTPSARQPASSVVSSSAAGANRITARAQDVSSGRVVIDSVTATQDGWLLIRKNANGLPGETLGFAPVHQGTNLHVKVDVRTTNTKGEYIAVPVLWATLAADPNAQSPFAQPDANIQQNILAKVAFGTW